MLLCLEFANCIIGPCYSSSLFIFLFLILLIMILVLLFCSISLYFSSSDVLSFLHSSLICFHFHLALTHSHLLLLLLFNIPVTLSPVLVSSYMFSPVLVSSYMFSSVVFLSHAESSSILSLPSFSLLPPAHA